MTTTNFMTHNNRLPVIFGTVLVMIGLGTIYTWSLFNQPLADQYGHEVSSVAITFSIMSFALSISTIPASKIQQKLGIRGLLILSSIGMGIGFVLTSFASELWIIYITAGVIVGAANGIAYMTTLSNAIQWFPEKKGLISGVSVGSYGIGSILFKYILEYFLTNFGVKQTFFYWGILAFLLIAGGAFLVKQAQIVTAEKAKPNPTTSNDANVQKDYSLKEMLETKQAYLLFGIFFTACLSGLYLIGSVANIGTKLANLDAEAAANAVAFVALFNTAGRLILGAVSDHFPRLKIIGTTLMITAAAALVLSLVELNYWLFFICVASVAFCFGGNITIFPTIVSDFYGLKNQSQNYGIIYQGFGFGGLASSFITVILGGFAPTFTFIAILCMIFAVIAMGLHAPDTKKVRNKSVSSRKLQKGGA